MKFIVFVLVLVLERVVLVVVVVVVVVVVFLLVVHTFHMGFFDYGSQDITRIHIVIVVCYDGRVEKLPHLLVYILTIRIHDAGIPETCVYIYRIYINISLLRFSWCSMPPVQAGKPLAAVRLDKLRIGCNPLI